MNFQWSVNTNICVLNFKDSLTVQWNWKSEEILQKIVCLFVCLSWCLSLSDIYWPVPEYNTMVYKSTERHTFQPEYESLTRLLSYTCRF